MKPRVALGESCCWCCHEHSAQPSGQHCSVPAQGTGILITHTAPVHSLGAQGCRHCSKILPSSLAAAFSWCSGVRGAGTALAGGLGRTDRHLGEVDRWTPHPSAPAGAGCRQTALLHTLGQQSSLKASGNSISHGEGC